MDCTGRQRHHHSSHHRYLRSRNLQQSQESRFLIVRFRSATTPSTARVPLRAGVATTGCGVLDPCARNAGVFVTPDLRIKQTWLWTMSTRTLARQTEHIRLQQAAVRGEKVDFVHTFSLSPRSPLDLQANALPRNRCQENHRLRWIHFAAMARNRIGSSSSSSGP